MAAHAEQNLVNQAAYSGVSIKGADIYVDTMPCSICLKSLINCKISKIYYQKTYPDLLRDEILKESLRKKLFEIEQI